MKRNPISTLGFSRYWWIPPSFGTHFHRIWHLDAMLSGRVSRSSRIRFRHLLYDSGYVLHRFRLLRSRMELRLGLGPCLRYT